MGPASTNDDPVLIDLKEFNGERFILQKPEQSSRHYTDLVIAHDHAEPGSIFLLENLESSAQLAAEGYGISFNFYQYMRRSIIQSQYAVFGSEVPLKKPYIYCYNERKTYHCPDAGTDRTHQAVCLKSLSR